MKFMFRFDTILDHYRQIEQRYLAQLASLNQEIGRLEDEIEKAKQEYHEVSLEVWKRQKEVSSSWDFMACQYILCNLRDAIKDRGERVKEKKRRVSLVREKLQIVSSKVMQFENLKEKEYRRYRDRMRRHEQKQIDELNMSRFGLST